MFRQPSSSHGLVHGCQNGRDSELGGECVPKTIWQFTSCEYKLITWPAYAEVLRAALLSLHRLRCTGWSGHEWGAALGGLGGWERRRTALDPSVVNSPVARTPVDSLVARAGTACASEVMKMA